MPVDASVQTKVAEIRRNSIGIGGIIAEDRDRNPALGLCRRQLLEGFGDVEVKLVITALMRSDEQGADPERGRLPRTLEVQDRSPFHKRITQRKPRTVPSLATKIRLVGIARVIGVEAVGKDSGLPRACLFRLPNLADAADRAATEFPPRIHPPDACARPVFCRSGQDGGSGRGEWRAELRPLKQTHSA